MVEQNAVWLVVGLLGLSIPLIALARRANVSYPIVLVLGGLALGFIPGLPRVALDPNLVLVIFLPPLLYWEAITAPTEAMRQNSGQIWVLAIGLVIATTAVVTIVAHAAVAGMPWFVALVLGAIVAPTDELASAPVLERMRIPRHLIAVVGGESLLNDASALIIYVFAVAAAVSGRFSFGHAVLQFFVAALGGIFLGLVLSRIAVEGWRRISDTQLQSVISVNLPYLTYSIAAWLGISGVLAVVYAGFYANRNTASALTPESRLRLTGFWETIVFLVNVVLFVMVGIQLHSVAQGVFAEYSVASVLWYAFVVNAAVIAVRFTWLLIQEYLPVLGGSSEHPAGDWTHAVVAGWSGLRGGVSLAAALAVPLTIAGGAHFPERNLIIFLTFSVILVTLVGGGLTLPFVIRALRVTESVDEEDEDMRRGIEGISRAALVELAAIESEGLIPPEEITRLRRRYEHHRRHAAGHPAQEEAVFEAERRLIAAQRRALDDMRERGEIDNTVMRHLLRMLDLSVERKR